MGIAGFIASCAHKLLFTVYQPLYTMIPGSKGGKSDASSLAGGFLTLRPVKNMKKQPVWGGF